MVNRMSRVHATTIYYLALSPEDFYCFVVVAHQLLALYRARATAGCDTLDAKLVF